MNLPIFQVDAFTNRVFAGNPAAICPLPEWLDDKTLQNIAAENNLSETAFFVAEGDAYRLRWFSPQTEVDLCGHATLATGFVLLNILAPKSESIRFLTRSGLLTVTRDGDLIAMDFPSLPPRPCPNPPEDLARGLPSTTGRLEVLQAHKNYLVIYGNEKQINDEDPHFDILKKLHPFGVCITAPGERSDFVSRYFAPSYGIPEDPVTGSTHSTLVPYWAAQLGKQNFHARQLSKRGGDLWCELRGERVILEGNAVLYLTGSISV